MTSQFEEFSRNDTGWAALLYKSRQCEVRARAGAARSADIADMRAPGAATGVYALESAMDELAVALKIDPLELRLSSYSDTRPE